MDFLPHEKKIQEYLKTIEHLKKQSQDSPLFKSEVQRLEQKLEEMKEKVYSELTPWERVQICRHPDSHLELVGVYGGCHIIQMESSGTGIGLACCGSPGVLCK